MAIKGLELDEFKELLAANLTPAKPISNPEYLRGREAKLQQIERAFNSPGKHVFIYGDRGVGKTSLAQTAAVLRQSADHDPIVVACDQGTTFFQLVRDMAKHCLPARDLIEKRKTSEGFSAKAFGLSYDLTESIDRGFIPEVASINDAANMMRYIAQYHSKEPVIVVDEFDQLRDDKERKYFADLIKQLSDQNIKVRLIVCGIGSSLDDLLGSHMSTGRYLAPIELERLTNDARWEIINSAAKELRVAVDYDTNLRIGLLSDGFPYYVHLIGEMLFWSMFDDPDPLTTCQRRNFEVGVKGAVSEAQSSLKFAYDKATQKYSDVYQEVLWAVADHVLLRRQITDIYKQSYLRIMQQRTDRETLDRDKFYSRMHSLRSDRHGSILVGKGAGWYEFRENIVRGYVRLKAQEHGVQLGKDYH